MFFSKNPTAQKILPVAVFFLGIFFPLIGIFFNFNDNNVLALIFMILGLVALGFITTKELKVLSILSYISMFIFTSFGIYLSGLSFLKGTINSMGAEKLFICQTTLITLVFLGFSHYLMKQEGWRKLLGSVFTLLTLPIIGFLTLVPSTFFVNKNMTWVLFIALALGVFGLFFVKGAKTKATGILGVVIIILLFVAKSSMTGIRVYILNGDAYTKVQTKADLTLENALEAYNNDDIDTFSSYFTSDGASVIQETFEQLRDESGDYESQTKPEIYYTYGLYFVMAPAQFSEESSEVWLITSLKESGSKMKIHTFEVFTDKPDF